jgi:hypothetical protein
VAKQDPDYVYSHTMRGWKLALAVLAPAFGCSSTGTQATAVEAGLDATSSNDASSDGGEDAGEDADATLPTCVPLVAAQLLPSNDCVFAGTCEESCSMGASSAYYCAPVPPIGDAALSPTYPSVFTAPIGIVNVIANDPSAYPWEAGAFVSCAPVSCVRWSLADHVGGPSVWPGDPCSDAGDDLEAWTCPSFAGVQPPAAGCFDTGGLGAIGGPGTGVPPQNVWCCPGLGLDAGMTTSDASVGGSGASDAGSPEGGPDAAND